MVFDKREYMRRYMREWVKANPDKRADHNRAYHETHLEEERLKSRKWRLDNPGKNRAKANLYRARRLRATPPWVTKAHLRQIEQFYVDCPVGYHVDHIYPLKGRGSSGLHVLWNLQYLPAHENLKKGNHEQR